MYEMREIHGAGKQRRYIHERTTTAGKRTQSGRTTTAGKRTRSERTITAGKVEEDGFSAKPSSKMRGN